MRSWPMVVVLMAWIAMGCGPSRRSEDTDPVCAKGETNACTCEPGREGTAACLDDGSGFGACACAAVCAVDETKACTCEGGAVGVMACRADRSGFGACACEGVCEPAATEACRCDDGTDGARRCDGSGAAWGRCACREPIACTSGALTASGGIRTTKGNVAFEGRPVDGYFSHRRGEGAGCLASATLHVALAGGCSLSLDFGAIATGVGGLLDATLDTTGCPGFTASGSYSTPPGFAPYWFAGTTSVADGSAAGACVPASTITFPSRALVLRDAHGAELSLNLDGLTISGALASSGDAALACLDTSRCQGRYAEGANAWCVKGCSAGEHDGGDGSCLPAGECIAGFHDDGTGRCVPAPECAAGFHDGGDGTCVAGGTCSAAFVLDLFGNCTPDPDLCVQDAPIADAGSDRRTDPNVPVVLDGRASSVTHGPARYAWSITSPPGAAAQLATPTGATSSFSSGANGVYGVSLKVTDARGCLSSDSALVRVGPGPRALEVTLTWAEQTGDLDIHFVGPNGTWFDGGGPFGSGPGSDAHYAAPHPDWGANNTTAGDARVENDPELVADDLWGQGPEKLRQPEVFEGSFVAGAHFYCDRDASSGGTHTGPATATLAVAIDGGTPTTVTRTLRKGEAWSGLRIDVSSGGTVVNLVPVDTVSTQYASKACQ